MRISKKDIGISKIRWLFGIFLPTIILISLPPAAGAVVAYASPPRGWGCRYLRFMVYAGCQVVLTVTFTLKAVTEYRLKLRPTWIRIPGIALFYCCSIVLYFLSLFSAIAGTMMQVMGVYKNCFCYVNAPYWSKIHLATVGVASDTVEQRNSSQNWISMGITATAFMAVTCYIGWWYQRLLRHRFAKEVESLYDLDSPDAITATARSFRTIFRNVQPII